jgi:hypothetical protein
LKRRRWIAAGLAAAALFASATWVAFATVKPAKDEDGAVGAAVNVVDGDDPNAGTWAACDYAPDAGVVLLRVRYECVVRSCRLELARLEVVDRLLEDDWTYEVKRSRLPEELVGRSGTTRPVPSTRISKHDVSGYC